MFKKKHEFWITNISRECDVALRDLRLTIRKGKSMNLLNGHSPFTLEELQKSAESGSIFQKRHLIKVREEAPVIFNYLKEEQKDRSGIKQLRKAKPIVEIKYEELDFDEEDRVSEEKYAAETADLDMIDKTPLIAVDPKFKRRDDE